MERCLSKIESESLMDIKLLVVDELHALMGFVVTVGDGNVVLYDSPVRLRTIYRQDEMFARFLAERNIEGGL